MDRATLLANIDQAIAAARSEQAPVHLNIAYRKPFPDPDWNPRSLAGSERETMATWYHRAAPYCTYVGGTAGRRRNFESPTPSRDLSSLWTKRMMREHTGLGEAPECCGPPGVSGDGVHLPLLDRAYREYLAREGTSCHG